VIIFTPNTVIKSADVNLNFDTILNGSLPSGLLYFDNYGGGGGQVIGLGAETVLIFNKFQGNGSPVITQNANGVFATTLAGFYFANLSVKTSDVGALVTLSIQWSPDNVNWYQVAGWNVDQTQQVGRGQSVPSMFYLPANAYVRSKAFVGTTTRFSSATADYKYQCSLGLVKVG
jgi:hypothetical protein